ncbi:phosphatidylinositol 4-phosphate 5-kinase-like protein 1 isoform X5 [Globicephala melas]|uniref:phosphatidylinositol 4-phosphate 5-kinase-like protein 1 isoform X5 n=1 Tax=Globicephala melas TaxID=9731 RepID=UPI00293D2D9A|nr:phosphatidylinositol 4-phosphate 5-kinase-like protein 1 isoform X5 [Globicephala melas]
MGMTACPRALQEGCAYPDPPAPEPTVHTWAPGTLSGLLFLSAGLRAGHPGWPRLRPTAALPRAGRGGLSGCAGSRRPLPAVPQHLQEQGQLLPVVSWWLGHDQRFFLKTLRRREVRALLAHLPRYVQHLQRHPHSLLARLLGVHSLRVARGKKKYFIIMQSVFYPTGRISERYDIKGCEVSRWVEPAPEGSPLVLVLKDLNFQGKIINLGQMCMEPSETCLAHNEHSGGGTDAPAGPQRSWLLRQMELDTAFLRELNVLDYSLLMAFQRLHEDEQGPGSSLIFRTTRSMRGVQSLEEPEAQNRRLLPDTPNALHILDGPEQRYFLGLVDLTTAYGLRKRLEHLWKTLRYPGRTFSTVSPTRYARRLCQWVEAHTE